MLQWLARMLCLSSEAQTGQTAQDCTVVVCFAFAF